MASKVQSTGYQCHLKRWARHGRGPRSWNQNSKPFYAVNRAFRSRGQASEQCVLFIYFSVFFKDFGNNEAMEKNASVCRWGDLCWFWLRLTMLLGTRTLRWKLPLSSQVISLADSEDFFQTFVYHVPWPIVTFKSWSVLTEPMHNQKQHPVKRQYLWFKSKWSGSQPVFTDQTCHSTTYAGWWRTGIPSSYMMIITNSCVTFCGRN